MTAASLPALPDEHLHSMLKRYLQGISLKQQAAELGVHPATVYSALITRLPDQWRDTQIGHAMAQYEQAKLDMQKAVETHELVRARETLATCRWELAKLARRIYGEEQAQAMLSQVNVTIDLGDHQITVGKNATPDLLKE